MSKARAITRVHTRSEQERIVRLPGSRRYVRANSPQVVRGAQGTRTENVRGRYSSLDQREDASIRNDKELRARSLGRRNKLTAQVAGLRKSK